MEVAIKRPAPGLTFTDTALDQFLRVNRVVSSLVHPGILRVYDAGVDSEGPYLVTELAPFKVEGPLTLAERISASGPLGRDETIDLVGQLSHALLTAYSASICHGFINPFSFLTPIRGTPKIGDFGISATCLEPGPCAEKDAEMLHLAAAFQPPEFAVQTPRPTPRSDVYSVGGLVHYCLTAQTLDPASETDRPAPLTAALVRATSPSPVDRFRSVQELMVSISSGTGTAEDPAAKDVPFAFRCPKCDTDNPPDVTYCRTCGTEFVSLLIPCPECGHEIPRSDRRCQACGTDWASFFRAGNALAQMKGFMREQRWQAAADLLDVHPAELCLPGPRGTRLREELRATIRLAVGRSSEWRVRKERIEEAVRTGDLERATRLLEAYTSLAPDDEELARMAALLRARMDERDWAQALRVVESAVTAQEFGLAVQACDTYLSKQPDGIYTTEALRRRDGELLHARRMKELLALADGFRQRLNSAQRCVLLSLRLRNVRAQANAVFASVADFTSPERVSSFVRDREGNPTGLSAADIDEEVGAAWKIFRRRAWHQHAAIAAVLVASLLAAWDSVVGHRTGRLDDRLDAARQAMATSDYLTAWEEVNEALRIEPGNPRAVALAKTVPWVFRQLDIVPVADAQHAPLDNLAEGSSDAQDLQLEQIDGGAFALEVRSRAVGVVFRLVPSGGFRMGSPDEEPDRSDDERDHGVTLTTPFYCGKTEVTQAQWRQVMGSSGPAAPPVEPTASVENVSWEDCRAFVRKLCELEGVPEGTYRLLTEAEWEYACRAGTSTSLYNVTPSSEDPRRLIDAVAWHSGNAAGKVHPVAQKPANAWGLHDMHGNVWEWCSDRYGAYPAGDQKDPVGPKTGESRVRRGGSWRDEAAACRSGGRSSGSPEGHDTGHGLRIVRSILSP